MQRAELPSGAYVDYRETLTAGDRFHVMSVYNVTSDPESGQAQVPGGLQELWRNALLEVVITGWGGPSLDGKFIPADARRAGGDPQEVLRAMDLDDYNALADAVEPLMQKVIRNPNRPGRGRPQSPLNGS